MRNSGISKSSFAGGEKLESTWIGKAMIRVPLVSRYVELRGAAFMVSWLHRISGLAIFGFVAFHLVTLQALKNPQSYDAKMAIYSQPLLAFLEWALAVPIIFHALNGGRLIRFESFGSRQDDRLLNGVMGLGLIYCGSLGIAMLAGSLKLPAAAFWSLIFAGALALTYFGARKIWKTAHGWAWKIQRFSGLFLLIMVPTHLIFMHMNPVVAKESATVLTRLQNPFIRFMDFTLAAAVLYHGAYGLTSIANDYIVNRTLRRLVASIAIVAAITLSVLSLRLLVF